MLLNDQQFRQVSTAVHGLTPTQLAWVGGYLSGLSQSAVMGQLAEGGLDLPQVAAAEAAPAAQQNLQATVLYGTQTGNSKKVANQLTSQLEAQGIGAKLVNMKDYRPQQLKKEQLLFVVVSTHGNGEPPDEARAFFKFINSDRAPCLHTLQYSVLALGDSSYEEFCQTGNELDKRLAALGASRLVNCAECDVDFAEVAAEWQTQIANALPKPSASGNVIPLRPNVAAQQAEQEAGKLAGGYFQAEMLNTIRLTTDASDKEVFHFELSLEDSGLQYAPGDILEVKVLNDDALVNEVVQVAGFNGSEEVTVKDETKTLAMALKAFELTSLTRKQLRAYAEALNLAELMAAIEEKKDIEWLEDADWVDVLKRYPLTISAQAFVNLLRPLQARQYSIASSPEAHPDEVHLLIKRVEYQHLERVHKGVASNHLAQIELGETVEVSVKVNDNFKLPSNAETKVIMIGAGTGVAPFRSFLFERDALGIQGNTWLFFGEQHFRSDFLYQVEWQELLKNGTLERMSVAFSRDQAEKIYVQHRIIEQAAELYQWLQQGAHVYVCGDMHKMAKDVHQALLQVMMEQGKQTAEQAEAELEQWIAIGRYQRDVY